MEATRTETKTMTREKATMEATRRTETRRTKKTTTFKGETEARALSAWADFLPLASSDLAATALHWRLGEIITGVAVGALRGDAGALLFELEHGVTVSAFLTARGFVAAPAYELLDAGVALGIFSPAEVGAIREAYEGAPPDSRERMQLLGAFLKLT